MRFPQGSNPAGGTACDPIASELPSGSAQESQLDRTELRLLHLERARDLARRLRLPVAIDVSGWLTDEIEISIQIQHDRTIRPIRLRVGPLTKNLMLLDPSTIHGSCTRYNELIGKLRRLKTQVTILARDVRIVPGSRAAQVQAELHQLDALIACRQRDTMGHGVVRLQCLAAEIEVFDKQEARIARIVAEYMRSHNARR